MVRCPTGEGGCYSRRPYDRPGVPLLPGNAAGRGGGAGWILRGVRPRLDTDEHDGTEDGAEGFWEGPLSVTGTRALVSITTEGKPLMEPKPWYFSKTLIVNILLLIADVLNGVYGSIAIPDNVKLYVVLVVNVVLRLLTDRPVKVLP